MRHLLPILCGLMLALQASSLEITNKTVIFNDGLQLDSEIKAAELLADILGSIFGSKVSVKDISEFSIGTPAIILKPDKLDSEEWTITANGNGSVTIAGGRPRGVLYGCIEFLEKFGDCRRFTAFDKYIPEKQSISLPDDLKIRRKPYFAYRCVGGGLGDLLPQASFNVWNKQNGSFTFLGGIDVDAEYGKRLFQYRYPNTIGPNGHSFYYLSRKFPIDKPEYFSLDRHNRRLRAKDGNGPGQICLSNPQVRKLIKKQIAEEKAAALANAAKKEIPPPFVLDISHNDNGDYCVCAACSALIGKYGSISALMIDFVNDIAASDPDLLFQTFAYTFTEQPPKAGVVKAKDNVVVRIALLGSELMNGPCDTLRGINHPNNRKAKSIYNGWQKVSKQLNLWLYHRKYRQMFAVPTACFWNFDQDFKYYKQIGVREIYAESEYGDLGGMMHPNAFYDLHIYLALKMMDDPTQDARLLINDFMEKYYGPAAESMKAYASYLEKRMAEEKRPLGTVPEDNLKYLDKEFLCTINKLLNQAMKQAGNNEVYKKRIALEYVPLDFSAAKMWDRIPGLQQGLKMSLEQLLCRLEINAEMAIQRYFGQANKSLAETLREYVKNTVNEARNPLPIPEELAGRSIRQFSVATMGDTRRIPKDDPDAVMGKAQHIALSIPDTNKMEAGIYNYGLKNFTLRRFFDPSEIRKDEKYHIYYLGRSTIPPPAEKPALFMHCSWGMNADPTLKNIYSAQDASREYDIFLSLKFTGQAYAPGSTKPNGIWFDRVIYAQVHNVPDKQFAGKEYVKFKLPAYQLKGQAVQQSDLNAPSGNVAKIPLTDNKPMEFCLYSYAKNKHLARRKIAASEIKSNQSYNWYNIMTLVLPPADEKVQLTAHDSWLIDFNGLLDNLRKKSPPGSVWQMYACMKFKGNTVWLDSVVFVKTAKGKVK